MMKICEFPDCGRKVFGKGWCVGHYEQVIRKGIDPKPLKLLVRNGPECQFDGCERIHMAKGLCNTHYLQQKKGIALKPITAKPRQSKVVEPGSETACLYPDCDRGKFQNYNLCSAHRYQERKGIELRPIRSRVKSSCKVEECTNFSKAKGLCEGHLSQFRRGQDFHPIKKRTGERKSSKTVHGYVLIWKPEHENRQGSGYILEHVFVMSEALGRPLYPHENVHHINGIRDDNKIENLELWSTSQPKGQRVADKVRWCKEFLAEYEELGV